MKVSHDLVYNWVMDTDQLTTITAPADWKNNSHWFESRPEDTRSAFAREHCSKVYSCDGQSCLIVSYPRQVRDRKEFNVAVYDIDAGRISWAPLSMLKVGIIFDKEYRASEEVDFEFDAVLDSDVCDEAFDISCHLFDV